MMNYLKKSKKNLAVKITKTLLFIYRGIFPSNNRTCRFEPTCSQYLLDAVIKHGTLKGIYFFAKRVMACHPYSARNMFDPVQ